MFITTLLRYPHWLFGLLGLAGAIVVYVGCIEEDHRLVDQFGDDYVEYMRQEPRINIVVGLARRLRKRRPSEGP